ncbi:Rav1p NDAI_0G04860 [Naumovozyma dairenensis CBS 421]|uniref:RAVE complex protein Rav1 C-terminal domain-containing protein n=1 Tax=Naumovozyma dairenensis (strain ATCC 10597 / BCRC 20456 / CBS 421 / NBRC 0211 / NRRL Y-12639) TaxID=1071378 RepID=J7RED9_NAUDC|nr:hypothetical protein NDAI_0G04860 [Naumovozyma dairenensis CBS 421]CCK73469.1 hypothetical protein NDAI_0G04860 [Naumovozyma dairenensis CBS 421]
MSLKYLPGRPNDTQQTMCQTLWQDQLIFAYCSGNNLIILSNDFTRLQTIYLETKTDCPTVDINPENGFIAVAVNNKVNIFKPIHQVMKTPKWVFCCQIYHDDSQVNCLQWGHDNGIVIGSNYLSFWKIRDEFGRFVPILLWNKRQPKPVYLVVLSNDCQLIASCGKFDHSVKLWKRISISGEQDIFNLTLLPHPDYVTSMRWKKTGQSASDGPKILYTSCEDKHLRIWSCYQHDSGTINVQAWGQISLKPNQKFYLIIDSWIIQNFLQKMKTLDSYFIDKNVDIALIGDTNGRFEVVALENLSNDPPKPLVHKNLLSKLIIHPSIAKNPDFLYFAELQPYNNGCEKLSLIANDLGGKIRHSSLDLSKLLDQKEDSKNQIITKPKHKFTGHNKSIQKLIRSNDGEAMLTLSRFSENCLWYPQQLSDDFTSLELKNIIKTEKPIKLAVVQEKGNLVINLLENHKLQVWDCPNIHHKYGSHLCSELVIPEIPDIEPILMLNAPEKIHHHDRHFVMIIYSDASVKAFEISKKNGILEVATDSLKTKPAANEDAENYDSDIYRISTIDPVHTTRSSNRPLISLITKSGIIKTYRAIVIEDHSSNGMNGYYIKWEKSHHEIQTGIENALFVRGSSTGKICTVNSEGNSMSLFDVRRGVLEYSESFSDKILDIDWTSTDYGQSIVSIGFTGYALLYTQLRYDYTNNNPSYLPIEKIDITSHTAHNIGDSIWLKNAMFVVASGNQLYIKDRSLDLNDPFTNRSIGSRVLYSNDIINLSNVINGPVPVYHPQFIIQALYSSKLQLVKELLLRLFLLLREIDFKSKDITTCLPSDLNIEPNKFFISKNKDYPVEKFPDPYPEFNRTVALALSELLTRIALPFVTRHQQKTLITTIEAMEEIMKNENTVDYNGIRFLLGVKLFIAHREKQKTLLLRDISWALHSDNKEILLSLLGNQVNSWERVVEFKLAYWVKESNIIRVFEDIAKFEFSKNDTKDPSRCAIFYLALKKKQILLSLWKISIGHPEQQKMLKFLSNDFNDPRWKTAALKNAFVLLSKHRYMDAACFFLLADSLKDCINVLYKQVEDLDLAIAVCRIYEGDNGPVLGDFLSSKILPDAIIENDRWLTSFIYWKLRKQDLSIKALVTSPIDLENNSELVDKTKMVNKSFLVEDPALLFLYEHLRKRNIKYFMGSLEIGEKIETRLILRVVDIMCRMGCNYLAVSLVCNWKFIDERKSAKFVQESPQKNNMFSSIDAMAAEPIITTRFRPSLFDKFKESGSTETGNSTNPHQPISTPNLLDAFSVGSSTTKSMLDGFSTDTKSQTGNSIMSSKSILDDFVDTAKTGRSVNTGSNSIFAEKKSDKPHNALDAAGTTAPVTKKLATSSAPRSLLDDFM